MHIRWLPKAAQDLEDIYLYLQEHHPSFANGTVNELYEGISSLKEMPFRGRPGGVEGTREFVFTRLPYIVTYQIRESAVEVLYIRHAAQDRP